MQRADGLQAMREDHGREDKEGSGIADVEGVVGVEEGD